MFSIIRNQVVIEDYELLGQRLGDPIIFGISLLDFIFFLLVLAIGLIVARILANSMKN